MPNPNPTIVHGAVSVDDVRTAYYRQAPQQAWIREFHTSPRRLIVANDADGTVARVDFDITDDGAIRFGQPVPVRVEYVENPEPDKVAASRLVYASAAESRPDVQAHGTHDQRTHGRRYGPGGRLKTTDRIRRRETADQRRRREVAEYNESIERQSDDSRAENEERSRPSRSRPARENRPSPPSGPSGDLPQRDAYESILEEAEAVLRQRFGSRRGNPEMAAQIERLRESIDDGDHDGAYGAGTALLEMLDPFLSEGDIPALRRPPSGLRMRPVRAAAVSDRPWSEFTEADYDPAQWRRACLLDRGDSAGDADTKGRYGLPVREPDGTLNRNGVHAAAGGHGISAAKGITDAQRRSAARKLVALYRQIGDEPPGSLLSLAGQSMAASADPHPQTPAAEPGNPTIKEDDMPLSTEVYQRLGLAEDADETAVNAAVLALADKADTAPDPTQVAAAAAEKDELTKEVGVLKGQVEAMSAKLAQTEAEKAAQVKASVLDTAVSQGKFAPAERERWEKDYDEAPAVVTRVLASIAPGTAVPVNPLGKVGDPADVAAAGELPPEPGWLFTNPEPALAGSNTKEN